MSQWSAIFVALWRGVFSKRVGAGNNRAVSPPPSSIKTRKLRQEAEQGHVEAQFNLGLMYLDGQGIPQDFTQAAQWFRKVAEQGAAAAQFNLGGMYEHGVGVPQDSAQAIQWYRKAAEQGYAQAQFNLGVMYD